MNLLEVPYYIKAFIAHFFRKRPIFLYYKPTNRCNSHCSYCRSNEFDMDPNRKLTVDQIYMLLDEARSCGFVNFVAWGGEPLLEPQLPDMLAYAQQIGMKTIVATNCILLAERASEILPHTNLLLASISAAPGEQDVVHGVPDYTDYVRDGLLEALKHPRTTTRIWSLISRDNKEQVYPLAEVAKELDIGIEFFPVNNIPNQELDIAFSKTEQESLFQEIINLKKLGYPIQNTVRGLRLIRDNQSYTCNFPLMAVMMHYDGYMYSCEYETNVPVASYGPWEPGKLRALVYSDRIKKMGKDLRTCNACRLPCMIDLSGPRFLSIFRKAWNYIRV